MSTQQSNKKEIQFALKIQGALSQLFDSDSEYFIDVNNLSDEDATLLMHALANIVPCNVYCKLTNSDIDILEFNHIANRLIMQNCNAKD